MTTIYFSSKAKAKAYAKEKRKTHYVQGVNTEYTVIVGRKKQK